MDPLPVVDLHCDMLAYLSGGERAHPGNVEDIGCATPHLQEGNVKLQVMAIFSPTGRGSVVAAQRQVRSFERLSSDHGEFFWQPDDFESVLPSQRTGIVAALENASGLCEEDEPLDVGFARLEGVARETGRGIRREVDRQADRTRDRPRRAGRLQDSGDTASHARDILRDDHQRALRTRDPLPVHRE